VYAVAIGGFGILCLGYVDFVNQLQPVPSWFPGYAPLALLTGTFLIAVGFALLVNRRTSLVATALAAVFATWIVALQIPSAFAEPVLLRSPWWVRTFETVAVMGAALVLAGLDRCHAAWVRRGRIVYGISLPVFGILHLIYPPASLVPPWYRWPMFWAYFTGLAMIAGGVAIVTGRLARLAATLAGLMYGTFFLTLHVPRSWCRAFMPCEFMGGVPPLGLAGSRGGLTSLFVALGMCGAAWIVAGALSRDGGAALIGAHGREGGMAPCRARR
jgi:uncharacterized membrane protein